MSTALPKSSATTPSVLRSLADGLWCVDHRDFSVGGLAIGTRSTVLRLQDGSLLLHSPGPISEAGFAEIRALGSVSHVVAPNLMHNLFFGKAAEAFPEARSLAVPGLAKKQPAARVDETLGESVPRSLAGDLEMIRVEGAPKIDEHVFFHAPSRTVLAVDMAFNIRNATGFFRFAMWLNDANDRFGMTRLGKAQYLTDHSACARSVDQICAAWDFDRVIVAHGEVLETGGRNALYDAYAFGRGKASPAA